MRTPVLYPQVKAEGTPNPYRLKPLVGVRMPLNSSYSPLIEMYNPHKTPLQVRGYAVTVIGWCVGGELLCCYSYGTVRWAVREMSCYSHRTVCWRGSCYRGQCGTGVLLQSWDGVAIGELLKSWDSVATCELLHS